VKINKKTWLKKINGVIFLLVFSVTVPSSPWFGNGHKIINDDCTINSAVFEQHWRKYADINDSRVPSQSKSWEAQQYHQAAESYINLGRELYELQCIMAVHAQMRLDNRRTLEALNRNIKVNLLKSFIRLSYFTYTTIKSAKGLGTSYANLFDAKVLTSVKLASAVKTVRHFVPEKSKLEINSKNTSGKLKSLSLSGALELVENFDDPNAIAESMVKDFNDKFLPSVKLSENEINVLRKQREFKDKLDKSLRQSYKQSKLWRKKAETMKARLKQLKSEMASWEQKEKERIKDLLIENCKKNKKKERRELVDTKWNIEKWWLANESWYSAGANFKSALPGFKERRTTFMGPKSKAVGIESSWFRSWSKDPEIDWSVIVKIHPYRTDAQVTEMLESARKEASKPRTLAKFIEKEIMTHEGRIQVHKSSKTWKGIPTYSQDMTVFYKNCTIVIWEICAPSRGEMKSKAVLVNAKALVDRKRAEN
jgi:hypothetical protein